MKKYHLADLLTCCEVLFTFILLIMTIRNTSVNYVIWVFIAGELCDAFDGICARRWHYPDDGKRRWWRTYASEIDKITDVFLAAVCGLYLLLCINTPAARVLVWAVCAICCVIQLILSLRPSLNRKVALRITLFRRYIYVIGISCTIILLIFATSWANWIKISALCLGIIAGIALVITKWNRLTQK